MLSTEQKAYALLIDGKVTVRKVDVGVAVLEVVGGISIYNVTFHANRWRCNCPARHDCAHIKAAQLIIPLRTSQKNIMMTGGIEID
jgi:hypothetical protein